MSELSKRIIALKMQGLSNNQVFQMLQKENIGLDKIMDALNNIGKSNNKVSDIKTTEEDKEKYYQKHETDKN